MPKITYDALKLALTEMLGNAVTTLKTSDSPCCLHAITEGKKIGSRHCVMAVSSKTAPDDARFVLALHIKEAELQIDTDQERHNVSVKYEKNDPKLYDLIFAKLLRLQEEHQNFMLDFYPESPIAFPEI